VGQGFGFSENEDCGKIKCQGKDKKKQDGNHRMAGLRKGSGVFYLKIMACIPPFLVVLV
jgi:hypothetical protein